ncbi:shikimate dehydrogenase [Fulvimarina sp. 2208YS6-2-32]|uniref:Shikimate dehydrogenase (NADP(+)) n=1 Tax=Fulvimarina uroteuthidis TaxID=3098149 RepID=A0ABU5HY15_9HYPH|nr:shikimate dehydrogenase [Fulvimarina sp. 2208YS6-2-32]MDY8108029.1 shikimate dehydrogenase [Fulvimarina sp. 2208YS6-2-32]
MVDETKAGSGGKTISERDAEWTPKPYVSGEARVRGDNSVFDPNLNKPKVEGPKAFITGWPVWHSRSPLVHGHWLKTLGIDGAYIRQGIPPEEFAAFLDALRDGGFAGGNVTIPHKEAAFRGVERRDGAAEAIGAVNTIWFEDGVMVGGNTDAYGFAANLDERLEGWDKAGNAVVIGAGGAARAVIHALLERGVGHVFVVNRTVSRAENLVRDFGPKLSAHGEDERDDLLAIADLLVNTAPVPEKDPEVPDWFPVKLPDLSMMKPDAMVTDIVYSPLMTPTLLGAEKAGLRHCDGLGMLLHQAVPGFERWFGARPDVTEELRTLVLRDLGVSP